MNKQETIDLINSRIKANGNQEITGNILNGVLLEMLGQINDLTGDLSELTTAERTNLVAAINEINNSQQDTGIKVFSGGVNPNYLPPAAYDVADFFNQVDPITNDTIAFWQFNGIRWFLVGGENSDSYLIHVGTISVVGNDVTYDSVRASIDGVVYETAAPTTINVPFAEVGMTRKDKIVIKNNGTLLRVIGVETFGISVTPITPIGTVAVDILDVSDNSISSNPEEPVEPNIQNLQSVLEQGSEAVIDNDFSVEKTNGNGKIAITGEGVKLEGQAKGVKIDGQGGDVDISGNGVNISGQGNGVNIRDAKLLGETSLDSRLTFGEPFDELSAYLEKFENIDGVNGFNFYSPGNSEIRMAGGKYLEIFGDLKISANTTTDQTFGLVLDNDNIIKRQLLPSGGGAEPSVIFSDAKVFYTGSKSFTIEEGVKVLTFKKNGSTISIDWTQVGNVITYNGLEDLNTEDYFIYNGIKAVSIVEVSGNVPDATTTIKGKLKLAGDLGGTADNPTVPALQNIYTKSEVDAKVSSVYIVKEPVATLAALNALTGQVIGWVRNVNDSGMNYVYTASGWDALGTTIDISGKEDKTNKTSNIEDNKTSDEKYTSPKGVVDYVATKIQKKPIHVFYKLPTPLTGTTAITVIHTFPLPKIYQEGRRIRISGRLIGTGVGGKTLSISTNALSIRNIVHSINGSNTYLPFVRNMVFFDNQYIYPKDSGSYYNDESMPIPNQSFSAADFQASSTVSVEASLSNTADSILAIDILFEFFD